MLFAGEFNAIELFLGTRVFTLDPELFESIDLECLCENPEDDDDEWPGFVALIFKLNALLAL